MVSRIGGKVNHPGLANRKPVDQENAQAKGTQTSNAREARDTRFDGMSGAERAEMQRFMSLKARHENKSGGAQGAVRNLGAATPLLFADQPATSLADAAKERFTNYDLTDYANLEGRVIDDRDPAVMDALPNSVRESYDHYYSHAEANDWGTVRLAEHELDGEKVYMVSTTTDGSDNYMELFDSSGQPLASGQGNEDDPRVWDETFGTCRAGVIWE